MPAIDLNSKIARSDRHEKFFHFAERVYKRRDSRAVDQRGQAGGEDDRAELPPVPVERGPAVPERDHLQPGEPVASDGLAAADWELVPDHLAAAAGEDWGSAGEARARY